MSRGSAAPVPGVVRIPLLFWKPGLATVPLLDVSLAPRGGGATHPSVRRPFEVLDQSVEPLSEQVLPALLPQFCKLEHYACAYHLPPRDVDQFVDEFPRGLSHVLSVALAFYALGADHALGGNSFRTALRGWAATGCPDKQGRVRPVLGVREKLAAVREENDEIEHVGGARIAKVLVPRENAAEAPEAAPAVVPVATFREALHAVFGADLVASYERKLSLRKAASSGRTWLLAGAVVLLLASWAVVAVRRSRDPVVVRAGAMAAPGLAAHGDPLLDVAAASSVVMEYRDGARETVDALGGSVGCHETERDASGHVTAVLAGLQVPGRERGTIVRLERDWLGSWATKRFDPWRDLAGPSAEKVGRGVRQLISADVLDDNPGPETIACVTSDKGPCLLAILDRDGRVLRSLWHDGTIECVQVLAGPARLLAWGCANDLPTSDDDVDPWFRSEGAKAALDPWALGQQSCHERVLFCIEAKRLAGRGPYGRGAGPNTANGDAALPVAPFDFYCRFTPKGYRVITYDAEFPQKHEDAAFVVGVTGWRIHVARDGNVVLREPAPGANGAPAPDLEPVVER